MRTSKEIEQAENPRYYQNEQAKKQKITYDYGHVTRMLESLYSKV